MCKNNEFKYAKISTYAKKLATISHLELLPFIDMINKQKPSAVYKETEERKSSGLLSLFWMILAIIIGVIIAVLIYRSPIFDDRRATEVDIQTDDDITLKTNANGASSSLGGVTISSPESIDYEFYNILPKQDFRSVPDSVGIQEMDVQDAAMIGADAVVRAQDEAKTKIEIVEENTTYDDFNEVAETDVEPIHTTYILQIKSYSDATSADEKRAQVMLAGVDAIVIRRVDSATNTTFYQVVSTPMQSRTEAIDALHKLRSNGIDALVVEQRHSFIKSTKNKPQS